MSNQTTFSFFSFITEYQDLNQLTASDWLNFSGSFGGALVAVGFAYYLNKKTERKIRLEKENETFIREIENHNEAIVILCSFLQKAVSDINGLLLKNYQIEKKDIEAFQKQLKGVQEIPKELFINREIIPPLDFDVESFSKRVSRGISKSPENLMCAANLKKLLTDYNRITVDRNRVGEANEGIFEAEEKGIKKYIENNLFKTQSLFDRTQKMLVMAEGILESLIYLDRILRTISSENKKKIEVKKIKGISVFMSEENPNHITLFKQLRCIIDSLPEYKNRQKIL